MADKPKTLGDFQIEALAVQYRLAEAQINVRELIGDFDPKRAKTIEGYIDRAMRSLRACERRMSEIARDMSEEK